MAVTETPPETVDAAAATVPSAPRPQPTGLAGVLGSGDHKVIGRLFIATSLLYGVLVLVLGLAFGAEGASTDGLDVFNGDVAFQLFTLMRVGTVFLLHPYILHAKAQNVTRTPRYITNPPIQLNEPMRFDRDSYDDHSLVEQAVLRALGTDRFPFEATHPREAIVPARVRAQQQRKEQETGRLAASAN